MADPIRSVSQAVEEFTRLPRSAEQMSVFRGHGNHSWKLRAPIMRADRRIKERENELVRELVAIAPDQFARDVSMFDRLVRMQHFGLPTRLLDTTSNPLVALFFAAESVEPEADGAVVVLNLPRLRRKYFDSDTVSCIANLSNLTNDERKIIEDTTARTLKEFNDLNPVDRLVQFVRAEKPWFRDRIQRADLFKRIHVIPKMNNPRIVAQSGSFILFGLDRHKLPDLQIHIKATRLIVEAAAKAPIRRELAQLGITESSLYPELDRAASNIVDRLCDGPDTDRKL